MKSPHIAQQVLERLLSASDSVRRRLSEHFLRHGLTEPRVNLLRTLAVYGEAGCSQVQVAEALGLCESSVCSLIERMRADGLLFRFRARHDRRKSIVVLSPEGTELLSKIDADQAACLPLWVSGLTDRQCRELLDLLDRLTANSEAISAIEDETHPGTYVPGSPAPRLKEAG